MRSRAGLFWVAILVLLPGVSSLADIPRLITYQGQLTDDVGSPVIDGDYEIDFVIFDDSTSGVELWRETQTVSLVGGLFSVQLGLNDSLADSVFADYSDLFLSMTLSGGLEMQPRFRLTASAFSFHTLSVADDAITGVSVVDGSLSFDDLGQSDATDGEVMRWQTDTWVPAEFPTGDITSVGAGDGLTGGGPSHAVTLNVGEGQGIDVAGDAIGLDLVYTDSRYLEATGDSMTGSLTFDDNADGTTEISIDPSNSSFRTFDNGELLAELHRGVIDPYGRLDLYSNTPDHVGQKAALFGSWWGEMNLYDDNGDPTVVLAANAADGGVLHLNQQDGTDGMKLYGGDSGDGARLYMYDAGGNIRINIDTDLSGNNSVVLPDGAISAAEIGDEAGITGSYGGQSNYFLSSGMQDLDTVEVTIPREGYIVIEGKCFGIAGTSAGLVLGYIQIDQTSGGLEEMPHYTAFGVNSLDAEDIYAPVYVTRTYFKQAGTHRFMLEGRKHYFGGGTAIVQIWGVVLTAHYYPTSYGGVTSLVDGDEAVNFDTAIPEAVRQFDPNGEEIYETKYRVDLRELELKAALARVAAQQAELKLKQAQIDKLEQDRQQNTKR